MWVNFPSHLVSQHLLLASHHYHFLTLHLTKSPKCHTISSLLITQPDVFSNSSCPNNHNQGIPYAFSNSFPLVCGSPTRVLLPWKYEEQCSYQHWLISWLKKKKKEGMKEKGKEVKEDFVLKQETHLSFSLNRDMIQYFSSFSWQCICVRRIVEEIHYCKIFQIAQKWYPEN